MHSPAVSAAGSVAPSVHTSPVAPRMHTFTSVLHTRTAETHTHILGENTSDSNLSSIASDDTASVAKAISVPAGPSVPAVLTLDTTGAVATASNMVDTSRQSDDSSSDLDSSADYHYSMPAGPAIQLSEGIEIPSLGGLPCVTVSVLTPCILRDLEDHAIVHFTVHAKKKTSMERKLLKLSSCFSNVEHMFWVMEAVQKQPEDITLSVFMDKIRACFLPHNWELQVHTDRESDTMKKANSFMDWAGRVKKKNAVLRNTVFHLKENDLRLFLQSRLHHDLMTAIFNTTMPDGNKLFACKELAVWEHEVQHLDNLR
jgi:hypothetical protein